MSQFIWTYIYCRYLGCDLIIHDPGSENVNVVMQTLHKSYGVEMRATKAGRPMANEQAESMVKNVKNKIKMLMYHNGNFSQKTI